MTLPKSSTLIFLSLFLSISLLSLKPRFGLVRSATTRQSTFNIIFTGDVMLGRSVNQNILAQRDAAWPFRSVIPVLQAADLVVINLESPLLSVCPLTNTGMIFCGQASNALGLKAAGVGVASIANNHASNYGTLGLIETENHLADYGIEPVGAHGPIYLSRAGQTLAFVAFNDVGNNSLLPSGAISQIKVARSRADLVFALFHWGIEYSPVSNSRQQSLAHAAIDAGADAVIGTHPHVVQEHEYYHGKPIYYSLGNFIFDQEWSEATKKGLAIRLTYDGPKLQQLEELLVSLHNYGQVDWQ